MNIELNQLVNQQLYDYYYKFNDWLTNFYGLTSKT